MGSGRSRLPAVIYDDAGRPICGAPKRQGPGVCTQAAGWGTNHPGIGRCKLHGGAVPIRSGRYSAVQRERLRQLIERFEADPEPLNVLPELATARALLADYLERHEELTEALLAWYREGGQRPPQILDVETAARLVSEVTKIVKRIEDSRAQNAVSRSDLVRILTEMGRVVERYVTDEATRERIRDGWLEIRL